MLHTRTQTRAHSDEIANIPVKRHVGEAVEELEAPFSTTPPRPQRPPVVTRGAATPGRRGRGEGGGCDGDEVRLCLCLVSALFYKNTFKKKKSFGNTNGPRCHMELIKKKMGGLGGGGSGHWRGVLPSATTLFEGWWTPPIQSGFLRGAGPHRYWWNLDVGVWRAPRPGSAPSGS